MEQARARSSSRPTPTACRHSRCRRPRKACCSAASRASALKKAADEAARTIPPREHGGNCDIKNISRGSRIYFPVYVKGAKLSMGDYHFSQGDGEITFCGAIEMAGWIHLHVDLIKGGVGRNTG